VVLDAEHVAPDVEQTVAPDAVPQQPQQALNAEHVVPGVELMLVELDVMLDVVLVPNAGQAPQQPPLEWQATAQCPSSYQGTEET